MNSVLNPINSQKVNVMKEKMETSEFMKEKSDEVSGVNTIYDGVNKPLSYYESREKVTQTEVPLWTRVDADDGKSFGYASTIMNKYAE